MARTGSNYGHGSGDIAIAFSTTQRISQHKDTILSNPNTVHETVLNDLFNAAAEATEQAIINALWYATDVTGRDNQTIQSLLTKLKSLNLM
nr:P1 family peptidase [Pelistega indica]